MRDLSILISASGSPSMPGIVDCFHNNGERTIRVVGMDMVDEPSAKYVVDAFYCVPRATDPSYCDVVLDICRKEKIDIYFPTISAEVSAVSGRISDFEKLGVIISVSNPVSVEIANDKLKTYETLKEAGIQVPLFYPVNSVEDFIEGCRYMGYPEKAVCLKIVDGSGSRGVRIIDSKKSRYEIFANEKPNSFLTSYEEMLQVLKEAKRLRKMMLVQYMPGIEYTVDLLADHGKVIYEAGRDNVVSLMSIAQESVVTYDAHAYDIAERVIELLKMDGNVGFDFLRDSDGTPILMDINPRLTATVSVIAAAGVNLPYLRVKQLLGEKLPSCDVKYGTRIKRRYGEIYTDPKGMRIYIGEKGK